LDFGRDPQVDPHPIRVAGLVCGLGVDSLQAWVEPERHSLCSAALQPAGTSYPACREEANESARETQNKKNKINLPEMRMSAFSRSYLLAQVLFCHSVDSHVPRFEFFFSRMDPFLNPPAVDSDPLLDPPKGI
jgi:hypothetical protein